MTLSTENGPSGGRFSLGDTMKIKITRSTVVGGKPAPADAVVDASDRDARFLIAVGKAVAYVEPPKVTKKASKKTASKADD